MSRVLHAPALHFVVAGGLLFALRSWWQPEARDATRPRIVVTAADVDRLRAEWTAQHGAPPGAETERAVLADAADEEILHREALAAGLDQRDRLVRTRLVKLARFLGEASEGDRDTVVDDARRLGLAEHDVVIRRHLTQVMRLALSRLDASDMPGESDLRAYLQNHADLFRRPSEIRLTHVYLSRDGHGAALERDAARLLDDLRRGGAAPETAPARGDVFLHGARWPAVSPADLGRLFGPSFADAIRDAPVAEWVGPVASSYGLHLVWIHERTEARMPSLDEVRAQVAHRLLEIRAHERLRSRLARLRARYEITIER